MIPLSNIKLPIILTVGKNKLSRIDKILSEHKLKFSNIIIISTKGIFKSLKSNLKVKYDKALFITESDFKNIDKILQGIGDIGKNSLILGIGGGKVIDITKCVATKKKISYLSIPTTLSNDGIYSPIAVISKGNKKERLGANIPLGIIIDLEVVQKAPRQTIQAGIGDLLSNLSALQDWKLAKEEKNEQINDFAYSLSYLSIETMLNNPFKDIMDYDFLKKLAYSLVLSGLAMEIAQSSRPCSGAEHIISHTIDYLYPEKSTLHGIQVAFGNLITELLRGNNITELIKFYKKIGLPTQYKDIGLNQNEIIKVIKTAPKMRKRFTIFNKINLNNDLIKDLLDKFNK